MTGDVMAGAGLDPPSSGGYDGRRSGSAYGDGDDDDDSSSVYSRISQALKESESFRVRESGGSGKSGR
eukprot:CAMPEP_0197454450 /NCGR_PEP_ID=MMETSP1175-20131217/37987_1 /TAXON_ID=1003142 /ORGANISM="Triceratium dubium, Strain CCMP147" /LENGTH=67 /DNA_ID=CAMNT_0042988033 /DNA_START=120 /DNA_END=320 /DNA_ORIENTATION=+